MEIEFSNRIRYLLCICIGIGLVIIGISLWNHGDVSMARAAPDGQGDPPNVNAEYKGTTYCSMCHAPAKEAWHNTAHSSMVNPGTADNVQGDLEATQALTITWPDGSERPITLDDITYVLGGRHVERYVSVIEREDGTVGYYVLPVEWNVPQAEGQTGTWNAYHADDWLAPERDWRVACAGCHTTGLDGAVAGETTQFVFADEWEQGAVELGIGCESCHGPGSEHMGTPDTIVASPDSQICGQCHVQGQNEAHDNKYPVGYLPGMDLADVGFEVSETTDQSVWWPTGHSRVYNQYGEWLLSGHGRELGLMPEECQRCHAPGDGKTDAENGDTYGVTCVACHSAHAEVPEGEMPLDHMLAAETYELCVSCHNSRLPEGDTMLVGTRLHYPVQEMFEGQQIVAAIEPVLSGHFTSEGGPRCVTCHMPQTIQLGEFSRAGSHTMNPTLCTDEPMCFPDSCTECHTDLSRAYLSDFVKKTQENVAARLSEAQTALDRNPDVSAWVSTVLDFVNNDGSMGIHNYAYTDALMTAVEVELNIVQLNPITASSMVKAEDPSECADCHHEEFLHWQDSPHALASTNETFLQEFASQGRPAYCMSCHASGYDGNTGTYELEGVVCSNCHILTNDNGHPPAPIEVADASSACGRCHSGAHAPTYDEWLVSDHKLANIDCVDCHTAHNNGLILGDVNSTCGDCHKEAMVDEIHMGQDMTCVDCHMEQRTSRNGSFVRTTGHTMSIDPGKCSECHGNTHLLSVRDVNQLSDAEAERLLELEEEVDRLETAADEGRTSDLLGGALGMLVIVVVLFVLLRLRKLL